MTLLENRVDVGMGGGAEGTYFWKLIKGLLVQLLGLFESSGGQLQICVLFQRVYFTRNTAQLLFSVLPPRPLLILKSHRRLLRTPLFVSPLLLLPRFRGFRRVQTHCLLTLQVLKGDNFLQRIQFCGFRLRSLHL